MPRLLIRSLEVSSRCPTLVCPYMPLDGAISKMDKDHKNEDVGLLIGFILKGRSELSFTLRAVMLTIAVGIK